MIHVKIVSGFSVKFFFFKLNLRLLFFLIFKYGLGSRFKVKKKEIQRFKEQFTIDKSFYKYVKHNNQVYINCNIPAIPFSNFFERILNLATLSQDNPLSNLAIVQIGFTKKCPLNCEHCYEGKILNQPEVLTLEEHKQIVAKLQKNGVPMIQFGGGEPLNRFNDLIEVLKSADKSSDFWIYSSGYGLTIEKANQLKKVGLTGVSVSLDHYLEAEHNKFRRNDKSFKFAIEAIKNAQNAGLLTTMTICVTKSFCSLENLAAYHQLALELKVPFVQLMEPRATGNYEGQNVQLNPEQFKIMEDFYISRNTEKQFKHFPIIQYTGYQQRVKSCGGAGKRYIYIDTDGYTMACPFCQSRKSHFLNGTLLEDIKSLKGEGCELLNKK
ncbi:MAG: radical SAM protein [Flavobacteriales bacterium]|nr:radical SAM protein [Flavobacteriales bacterium]